MKLALISTWNTCCGIAEYTRYLVDGLAETDASALIFADRAANLLSADGENVTRCWTPALGRDCHPDEIPPLVKAIAGSGCTAASIQFNFSFFTAPLLEPLIVQLQEAGLLVCITVHSINGPDASDVFAAIRKADVCVVHQKADMQALAARQLTNLVLVEHGVISFEKGEVAEAERQDSSREFIIGSFGFLLPQKGIYELILAFFLARQLDSRLRLKLLNAIYPHEISQAYARACVDLIGELGLWGSVELSTEFLDDSKIFREFATCDLLALPYLHSTDAASGAVRLPLSSLKPVLCSAIPIFDELDGVVHKIPAGNVFVLTEKLLELAKDPVELSRYHLAQAAFVQEYSWKNTARRFKQIIKARFAAAADDTRAIAQAAATIAL